MASGNTPIVHRFGGGWSTDYPPRIDIAPGSDGMLVIPYLTTAEDLIYELDGGLRKAPGTTRVNSAQMESGADIIGGYDAWFHGSSGTPVQARVVSVSTKLKADAGDGTFVDIETGLSAGAVPTFAMLEDLLVIGLDSTDVPRSYDGSTCQNLAGSPPNFSIVVQHANRLWAAGDDSSPSAVYYSPLLDPENATGEGWGRINVDPGDGDRVTALFSHKGELIVHKGPYKGSIHRIAGTAPTGSDAYRRTRWIEGVGAAWQNCQFRFMDDVGFMSFDGAVQSLKAVSAYGDYRAAALSRPIQKFLDRINFAAVRNITAATVAAQGMVLFTLPIDGSTSNNALIGFDYRFEEPRWFYWPSYDEISQCVFSGIDPSSANLRQFFFGGTDGYLRTNQSARIIDTSGAIAMRAMTPYMSYGLPLNFKTAGEAYVQIAPKNAGTFTFGLKRDSSTVQEFAIDQGAGDPLGTVDGPMFTLDSSALAESSVIERFLEADPVGEFRQIQFQINNDDVGEDLEVHGFGMSMAVGSVSTEN